MIDPTKIELNYGRNGSVTARDGTCSLCGQDGHCLVVDGSEGEYGEILCCRACVEYCFEQVAAPHGQRGGSAVNDDILRVEGEISRLEAEWRSIYAKAALFDVLAARIEAGAWVICDTVGGVKILLERTGERVFDVTLAEAVEKAMRAEGEAR